MILTHVLQTAGGYQNQKNIENYTKSKKTISLKRDHNRKELDPPPFQQAIFRLYSVFDSHNVIFS